MESRTSAFRAGVLAAAGVVVAVGGLLQASAWGLIPLDLSSALIDAVGAACTVSGAMACFGVGIENVDRRGWRWVGAGFGLWAVADLMWLGYRIGGVEAPYPSAADVFYLLGLLPVAIGLSKFRAGARRRRQGSRRLLLDTAVLAGAFALITYLVVLRAVVGQLGLTLETLLSVIYPVADMLFAAFACALVLRSNAGRDRWDLILLAAGFSFYAVADSVFAVFDAHGRDYDDGVLALGYIVAALALALAALRARTTVGGRVPGGGRRTRAWSAMLPDAAVFLAVIVCAASQMRGWFDWTVVGSVLALAAWRQFILASDNAQTQGDLERRVAERTTSLQVLADHHQSLLDSVGEGVMGIDENGLITFVNPAASRMLGGGVVDFLRGRSCAFTCSSGEPDQTCILEEVRLSGSVTQLSDERFQRVDGTRFPVEITAAPQAGPGMAQGVVLVFRDVTEKHAVARMKTEFISAVSHELRTPLTAIHAALELLADGSVGKLSPAAERMVETALRGSSRLTRLVSDIIDMERLESGTFAMDPSARDLAPIVEAAVGGLRVLADDAGVRMVLDLRRSPALCDADRIVQAVVNLVGNAVKFSPAGGTVRVSVRPVGEEVHFSVSDEGRGVPADDLELVFDRFHQVSPGDAREKSGTGLGLAITKSIIERHGGQVWVESEEGQGSTFRFALPAGAVATDSDRGLRLAISSTSAT
jgi:PAS domain S-box-containing protein